MCYAPIKCGKARMYRGYTASASASREIIPPQMRFCGFGGPTTGATRSKKWKVCVDAGLTTGPTKNVKHRSIAGPTGPTTSCMPETRIQSGFPRPDQLPDQKGSKFRRRRSKGGVYIYPPCSTELSAKNRGGQNDKSQNARTVS